MSRRNEPRCAARMGVMFSILATPFLFADVSEDHPDLLMPVGVILAAIAAIAFLIAFFQFLCSSCVEDDSSDASTNDTTHNHRTFFSH